MFPLMAQSVNDSREAKEEMRKERMEQHQQMQEKMWKQQNYGKQAEIDKMMMRMKMHDRKIVNEHKHHLNKFINKNKENIVEICRLVSTSAKNIKNCSDVS